MTNNEHKAAPTVAGLDSLTRIDLVPAEGGGTTIGASENGMLCYYADVERWAASHAGASAVPGELSTNEQVAEVCFDIVPDDYADEPGGKPDYLRYDGEVVRRFLASAATPSTAAVRAAEWISVSERVPADGQSVLVLCGSEIGIGGHSSENDVIPSACWWYVGVGCTDSPTHWMPTPPVPAADGGNGGAK